MTDSEKIEEILKQRHMSSCTGGYEDLAIKEIGDLITTAKREAKREEADRLLDYTNTLCVKIQTIKRDTAKEILDTMWNNLPFDARTMGKMIQALRLKWGLDK